MGCRAINICGARDNRSYITVSMYHSRGWRKRWQTKHQNPLVIHPLVKYDTAFSTNNIYTSSVKHLQLRDSITETSKSIFKSVHWYGKENIFWVTVSSEVHILENVTLVIHGSN